jgi:tetratricopeptide (TPR) repeat protein
VYNAGQQSVDKHAVRIVLVLILALAFGAAAQDDELRLAARLDSEQKCAEAERIYNRVVAQKPPSAALWNNLGNHYIVCGDAEKARSYFERVLKSNPLHANANLQLARIAVDRHQGQLALEYLSRVHDTQPAVGLLRAEALHWAGNSSAALTTLDSLEKATAGDERLVFLYGLTCARIGAYARAEAAFNAVLARHPDDFDVLFNLGRAAARAGHYERARSTLEVALKLRPQSVESLVELGQTYAALQDYAKAVFLLANARQLAPRNPEIALELARAAQRGEYYGDAAQAYDDYLRLRPGDAIAQRERAIVCGRTDTRKAEGLRDLAAYVRSHPEDPLGHYGLAQLSWRDQPERALANFTQALKLDPKFTAAYMNRAWLLQRIGRTEEAVADLRKAIEIDPGEYRALDQLGLAYSSLDRPADAEKVLRRAMALAPDNPDVLLHFGRTLMELGREEEAQRYLDKFERVRPHTVRGPWQQPGMIESATLPPAERMRRQIERLRGDARAHPDDPELQLHLAELLLTDGQAQDASAEFHVLLARNAGKQIWREAGTFLLGFEQYRLASDFLKKAAAEDARANLDLAIAVLFDTGPAEALRVLEGVPESDRAGDYLLLKARILDAAGHTSESEHVLEQGLRLAVSQPQIGKEAALLLVRGNRAAAALDLLNRVAGTNPDLLLTRAIVLGLLNQTSVAEKALKEIEAQWPEWDRPYLVHGVLLERVQPREAVRRLRTAAALGMKDLALRCSLARAAGAEKAGPECSCAAGLYNLLFPTCSRP